MTYTSRGLVIAIDGPVASGKGTISARLANEINGFFLHSGAVFRCIGLACIEQNVDIAHSDSLQKVVRHVHLEISEKGIFLNSRNVSKRILQEDVSSTSSRIAVYKTVRDVMVKIIRKTANQLTTKGIPVIVEGRDIATTVFPQADIKIYLTATVVVRAKRRLQQAIERGESISFEKILSDTKIRDKRDTERKISPLTKDPVSFGYFVVDNSNLNEEETLHDIMTEMKKKGAVNGRH